MNQQVQMWMRELEAVNDTRTELEVRFSHLIRHFYIYLSGFALAPMDFPRRMKTQVIQNIPDHVREAARRPAEVCHVRAARVDRPGPPPGAARRQVSLLITVT